MLSAMAYENAARSTRRVLADYEKASSQNINLEKSSIAFSPNTSREVVGLIHSILGVHVVSCRSRYLGLLASVSRNKCSFFRGIKDRIVKKTFGWGTKNFLVAAKGTLIKAVVQSIPTYVMSLFWLPTMMCEKINSICANF